MLAGGLVAVGTGWVSSPAHAQDQQYQDPNQQYSDPGQGVQENGQDMNFDQALSPYGQWVEVNGTRVWQPSAEVVGADFQPYGSGGRWVNTDYGWSFESDYDWGWATFHYGRWAYDGGYGWVWAPGNVWGPAWVDWRFGGGYVGWAPLPPYGFGAYVDPYHPYWCFVGTNSFVQPNVFHYAVPVAQVSGIYASTQPIHTQVTYGGQRWYQGPPAGRIVAATGQPVPHASINPPPAGRIQAVRASPPGGFAQNPGRGSPAGGFHGQPVSPNGGFNRGPTSGPSQFHGGPVNQGGGFHGTPSNSGGFHGAPANPGGGFHGAPAAPPAAAPHSAPPATHSGPAFHGQYNAQPNYSHPMAYNGGGNSNYRGFAQGRGGNYPSAGSYGGGYGGGYHPAPAFSGPSRAPSYGGSQFHSAPASGGYGGGGFHGGGSAPQHFSAPSGGGAHFGGGGSVHGGHR